VPNRVRKACAAAEECNPSRSNLGTMSFRRRITNFTGAPVSRLRFRINNVTTMRTPAVVGAADLRALSSSDITVTLPSGQQVAVQGTTVEEPPVQVSLFGGGWNSSWSPTGTISLQSPLPAGATINVQFLLGVQQTGNYHIFIIVEALP
jgi:hypothetical protein